MKKKSEWNGCESNRFLLKLFLMSKITFLLFFAGLLQVSATSYAQLTRLNLNMTDVPIVEVFEKIESQSEFRFFYDNAQVDLAQRVTVDVKNQKVDEFLDNVLRNTNITYEILDRHILITKRGKRFCLWLKGKQ